MVKTSTNVMEILSLEPAKIISLEQVILHPHLCRDILDDVVGMQLAARVSAREPPAQPCCSGQVTQRSGGPAYEAKTDAIMLMGDQENDGLFLLPFLF